MIDSNISEKQTFNQLLDEIKKTKKITDIQIKQMNGAFGKRFENAYRTMENGRVIKYLFHPSERIVWIVSGRDEEYQILPNVNFCSCDDFYFRVISNETFLCYHLVAQKLAEALNKYVSIERSDENYEPLMGEWRKVKAEKRCLPIDEVENLRRIASSIISEVGELSTSRLLEEVKKVGFTLLTTRHLANILSSDKGKRFKCRNGLWTLNKNPEASE